MSSEHIDLIGYKLAGRYEVVRLIGRGGMGTVFEVMDADGSRAAAKLVNRGQPGEPQLAVRRFLREARTATSIESPHVVRTWEVRQDPGLGLPFLVMNLLNGVDLGTLIRVRGALEERAAVRVFRQAARGIAAAHAKGIIHRDIKPANLFVHVEAYGGYATMKVCDFGVAKGTSNADAIESHEITTDRRLVGSPLYMSPEQALSSSAIDCRTDIWSVCASLYEALSGKKLWPESWSLGETILAICTKSPEPLRSSAPWVDAQLARVVHKGLERDPAARWPTIEHLLAALEAHAGGSDALSLVELGARPSPPGGSLPAGACDTFDDPSTVVSRCYAGRRGR